MCRPAPARRSSPWAPQPLAPPRVSTDPGAVSGRRRLQPGPRRTLPHGLLLITQIPPRRAAIAAAKDRFSRLDGTLISRATRPPAAAQTTRSRGERSCSVRCSCCWRCASGAAGRRPAPSRRCRNGWRASTRSRDRRRSGSAYCWRREPEEPDPDARRRWRAGTTRALQQRRRRLADRVRDRGQSDDRGAGGLLPARRRACEDQARRAQGLAAGTQYGRHGTPQDGHGPCRARTTWRSPSRPRLGLDHTADAAPSPHEACDVGPRRATKPRDERSALAGRSLRTRQTAFSESGADALAARNQERFFASRLNSWWPHGAPRLRCSLSSLKPDQCENAGISWIAVNGRSRTRTWDLFLIRETARPLQSPQLALNPCKSQSRRVREGTGGGLAGTS